MWIIYQADDSHKMSRLIFSEKKENVCYIFFFYFYGHHSLPLIQGGQLSISERMYTILVNHLEDKTCPEKCG